MSKLVAPHIRTDARVGKMMIDMLLAAIPLGVFSYVNYGPRPLYILLFSVLSAILFEMLSCLMRRRPLHTALDGSAAVTGLIIGLVMSPMAPYWLPMAGCLFAILVVKAPFGGTGRNVFNPAAAGIAVLSYCFPQQMFTYPAINSSEPIPLGMTVPDTVITSDSLAFQLANEAVPQKTPLEYLLGDFTGPIGATAGLILLAFAGYLLVRRTASPWIMLPYFGTCLFIAWMLPLDWMNPSMSITTQLCAGYVLFTGVFLINDPVTAPRFWLARLLYGVLTAVLVMLLQRVGRVESGCCFAVLMTNTLSPILDRWCWRAWRWLTQRLRLRKEVKAYE